MNTLAPLPGPLSVAPHARQSSGRAAARHEQPCKAFSSGVASPEPANRMPGRTRPPDPDSTAISFPSLPSPSPLPHLPEAESWAAPNPDCTPVDAAFALELRAESIEHLCGGDALRRGEIERIEAGGSDNDGDLVAGCDRVQVQGTLAEHTGHGLAVQAAHLATSVGGAFGTCAGKEDTMLLAGHMRDTWNGGSAVVAAMSDDLAAGGGVRATAPLDVWAHGLMGLEERPGTCTADGVLAEACGTLYEREYRSAVHAAGVAVFNGTLYQSARNSFRPLMRVSMGVRNLIAAGGGGAGGDVPSVSPPPAGAAGGEQGADAAAGTLAAGRGAAETPQSAQEAARLDVTEVLAREAGEAGAVADPVDVSELRRDADTAERLGGLRDGLHRGEVANAACADEAGAVASVRPTDGAHGALEIGPPAAVAAEKAPAVYAGDPLSPGISGKLGLLGGADDPPRTSPEFVGWPDVYRTLNAQYQRYREQANPAAVHAYREAIEAIDASVMQNYSFYGGRREELAQRAAGITETEAAYHALRRMANEARQARGFVQRRAAMLNALGTIRQFALDIRRDLFARSLEFFAPSLVEPPGRLGQTAEVSGSFSHVVLEDNPFFQELTSGMPEWHAVGPGGSNRADAIAGGARHVHEVDAVVAPQLATDSTLWTRPTQPVGTPATVQFDSGLQRAGTNGRPRIDFSWPGASGGAVSSSNTGVGTVAHGGGSIDSTAPWVEDDFAVERALNTGRLPADFDASGLIGEWGWLARNTAIDGQLESGLFPARTIESMVEGYRAMDPPGGYDLLIGQLEAMKAAITRALADAYGYRADPIWLARVDEGLQAHRGTEAADADALRQMDEVIHGLEIASGSLPSPVSRASVIDGSGFEVGGGALSPASDAWRGGESPGHVSFGHT